METVGRNGGCGICGVGPVWPRRGGGGGSGVVGRAAAPGNGGALLPSPCRAGGNGTGTVGADWGRIGMGVPARTGAGNRPEGVIRRELEFGAGGGMGGWVRTSAGLGLTPGCPVGIRFCGGKGPEVGRGGGMKPRVWGGSGTVTCACGTNSSAAGT